MNAAVSQVETKVLILNTNRLDPPPAASGVLENMPLSLAVDGSGGQLGQVVASPLFAETDTSSAMNALWGPPIRVLDPGSCASLPPPVTCPTHAPHSK